MTKSTLYKISYFLLIFAFVLELALSVYWENRANDWYEKLKQEINVTENLRTELSFCEETNKTSGEVWLQKYTDIGKNALVNYFRSCGYESNLEKGIVKVIIPYAPYETQNAARLGLVRQTLIFQKGLWDILPVNYHFQTAAEIEKEERKK